MCPSGQCELIPREEVCRATAVEQLSDTAGGLNDLAAGDLLTVDGIDTAFGAIS